MAEKSKAIYESDILGIEKCAEEEMKGLLGQMSSGDKKAENRLIEGNLYRVYEAAAFFESEKVSFMDLVQEGNLAMLLCARTLAKNGLKGRQTVGKQLDISIKEAMEAFVSSEEESYRAAEELKIKLNVIDEVCVRLAEEYGREATSEEVAEKMQMDPDDVRYLMRIALSAIQKEDGEGSI